MMWTKWFTTKTKTPYYWAKTMQFTLPFFQTLVTPARNLPLNTHQTAITNPEQNLVVPTENIDNLVDKNIPNQ